MVTAYNVETLLQPVKLELERAHGLDADWVIIVDEDRRGIQMIEVRLDIQRDATLSVEDVRAIKDTDQKVPRRQRGNGPLLPIRYLQRRPVKELLMNISPRDLLAQARHLIAASPGRPKQTDLRRAASDCYYAAFHALTEKSARIIVSGSKRGAYRQYVRRGYSHGQVRRTCVRFRITPTPQTADRGVTEHLPQGRSARNIPQRRPHPRTHRSP